MLRCLMQDRAAASQAPHHHHRTQTQVGKARATFEEDRTRILKQIREDYGGDEMALNLQIKQAVVASACDDATEMWDTVQAAGEDALWLHLGAVCTEFAERFCGEWAVGREP